MKQVPTSGPITQGQPSPKFADWLENDGGIYWIAGKAGSGKSTLMKYLWPRAYQQDSPEMGRAQKGSFLPAISSGAPAIR
jgi:putative ribosome biogenesis GTPase RsgA